MFNSDLKEKYLDEQKSRYTDRTLYKIETSFNRVEDYESKIETDISDMTPNQLINMFTECGITKKTSVQTYHSVFKKYIDWCMIEKGFKVNLLDNVVTVDVLVACCNVEKEDRNYFTQKMFEEYKNMVRRRYDKDISEYVIGVVMAIHEGIKGDRNVNLINLKASDFDVDNLTCKLHTGKTIKVSKELIEQLRKVYKIKELSYNVRNGKRISPLTGKLYDDTIFKFFVGGKKLHSPMTPIAERNIRTMVERFQFAINKKIRIVDLYECGLIHYVYNKYIEDGNEDIIEALNDKSNDSIFNTYLYDKTDDIRCKEFRNKFGNVIQYCV